MGQTPSLPMYEFPVQPEIRQIPTVPEWSGRSDVPAEQCGNSVPSEWYEQLVPTEWYGHSVSAEVQVASFNYIGCLEEGSGIGAWGREGSSDDIKTYISNALVEKEIDTLTRIDTGSTEIDKRKEEFSLPEERLFHVPRGLKKLNTTAYEPQLVSIGPRYHGKEEHLRDMEWQKKNHFNRLFNEKGPETKKKCEDAVRNMQRKARDWYGDPKFIFKKNFEKMMLVDGCFVILIFLGKLEVMHWINPTTLLGDLLLFENQLPLFLLEELYGLIKDPTDGTNFAQLACDQLNKLLPDSRKRSDGIPFNIQDTSKIDHLLGLVHDNWVQGIHNSHTDDKDETELKVIRCATELVEAGIVFKSNDRNQDQGINAMSLFDAEFKDGKMKMPTLVIDDMTERVLLNLIAYEVRLRYSTSTYVIDYARLMFNLVKKDGDVKLLRLSGVIRNNTLADDEAVAKMLKKLLEEVPMSDDSFLFHKLFDDVKKHCERRWNDSIATLRHDYLNTPWKRIGLVAAILGFVIPVSQLIVSILKRR